MVSSRRQRCIGRLAADFSTGMTAVDLAANHASSCTSLPENDRLEPINLGSWISPTRSVQTRLATRVRQKLLLVPSPLHSNLWKQQPLPRALTKKQPVPAHLNFRRIRAWRQGTQHRDLEMHRFPFLRRQRGETGVLESGATGHRKYSLIKRLVADYVTDASTQTTLHLDRHERAKMLAEFFGKRRRQLGLLPPQTAGDGEPRQLEEMLTLRVVQIKMKIILGS